MQINQRILKKLLIESGFIEKNDLEEAIKSAEALKKPLEDILFFRSLITEQALGELVAKHYGVNFIALQNKVIPIKTLKLIPEKLARSYRIIPFKTDKQNLHLAMEEPTNFETLEFAKRKTGKKIIPYYITENDLNRNLGQYKRGIKEKFKTNIFKNIEKAKSTSSHLSGGQATDKDLGKAAQDIPIIKLINTLIEFADAENASDIHLERYEHQLIVRFRIDGILRDILVLPSEIQPALVARIKILSSLKIDEHRIPQDGRFKFDLDHETVALRVSIIPAFHGENVVMRLLDESARPLALTELGLTGQNLEIIQKNIQEPHGMILVTGPTGSGKTTTLYSILNILNTVEVKICTVEDPIEYGIRRISQTQINTKAGLTFASGLRSLLRHDPDIIMVGEIRDEETADMAIHSALTGHLVLSTLHTNDAAGTIPRLLDMGTEGYLVASTLNLIIAQRLVRRICRNCITEYKPSPKTLELLEKKSGKKIGKQKFYRGEGCEECNQTGYSGRIGIYEVLQTDEKIRELIVKKTSGEKIKKVALANGMITLMEDGINKIGAGLTTIDEVLRVTKD